MVAYFLFLKTIRQATVEAEKDAIFVKKSIPLCMDLNKSIKL